MLTDGTASLIAHGEGLAEDPSPLKISIFETGSKGIALPGTCVIVALSGGPAK